MTKKLEVTVRLEDEAAEEYDKVVANLEKAGLSNVSSSRRFLIVHGEVDEARQGDLKRIKGVASVRPSQTFTAWA